MTAICLLLIALKSVGWTYTVVQSRISIAFAQDEETLMQFFTTFATCCCCCYFYYNSRQQQVAVTITVAITVSHKEYRLILQNIVIFIYVVLRYVHEVNEVYQHQDSEKAKVVVEMTYVEVSRQPLAVRRYRID